MINRRSFLRKTMLLSALLGVKNVFSALPFGASRRQNTGSSKEGPIVLSTWDFGKEANLEALSTMEKGGNALDAVEAGVRIVEADPTNSSVGYGGLPDRDGKVTLDACIMDADGSCGGVCFLEDIMHPISVARKVMENTPHVLLAGEGARQFALSQGFPKENMLTPKAKEAWKDWKKERIYQTEINRERHDTIGMVAMDANGRLAGACTTSGLSFKLRGRVGDSPIIGAGLFVDGEVGAAAATGLGEAVLKTAGTFLVVELMRQGMSPAEACEEAIMRIVRKQQYRDFQVGFLALNIAGAHGAFSIHPGFTYSLSKNGKHEVFTADSFLKGEK
ncbi:MAG: N(4)-(beta-N-acetylglucosaminyl)-L-asparaginase [Saprospirales bacterium]|nr:N(4)-(beta-N-acetylglucosaminyl)-L-asparaginase [Saprospirales bacterium]